MDQRTGDQKSHYGFSALEKEEVWERWARGESLKAIGRAFGKPSSSIRGQLSPYGGIRPAPRRRSKLARLALRLALRMALPASRLLSKKPHALTPRLRVTQDCKQRTLKILQTLIQLSRSLRSAGRGSDAVTAP